MVEVYAGAVLGGFRSKYPPLDAWLKAWAPEPARPKRRMSPAEIKAVMGQHIAHTAGVDAARARRRKPRPS